MTTIKTVEKADEKRTFSKVDLDTDINASNARIAELKRGRNASDIPMHDEFWRAMKKRDLAFTKKD